MSTQCYTSGRFDAALLKVLEHFEQVMAIMLPSLREERAQTYSPFLPIDPRTGIVLQVPVVAHDAKRGTITYEDPQSMRLKGEYIAAQSLSGAMFWELSNDDGRLLEALRAGLGRR